MFGLSRRHTPPVSPTPRALVAESFEFTQWGGFVLWGTSLHLLVAGGSWLYRQGSGIVATPRGPWWNDTESKDSQFNMGNNDWALLQGGKEESASSL